MKNILFLIWPFSLLFIFATSGYEGPSWDRFFHMVAGLQGGRPSNWVSISGGGKKLCSSSKRAAQTTPYSMGNAAFSPVTKRLERDWLLVLRLRMRQQISPQSQGVYSTPYFSSLQTMLSVSWHVLLLLLLLLLLPFALCTIRFFENCGYACWLII